MSMFVAEQTFYQVPKYEKRNTLKKLMEVNDDKRVVVFVEQRRNADFLAALLSEKKLPTSSIHGGRKQHDKELAWKSFESGRHHILIATSADLVTDIKNVDIVVNYDLPKSIDEYVRRIGQTGRLGLPAKVISFYDANQDDGLVEALAEILQQDDQPIPEFLQSRCDSTSTNFNNNSAVARGRRNSGVDW